VLLAWMWSAGSLLLALSLLALLGPTLAAPSCGTFTMLTPTEIGAHDNINISFVSAAGFNSVPISLSLGWPCPSTVPTTNPTTPTVTGNAVFTYICPFSAANSGTTSGTLTAIYVSGGVTQCQTTTMVSITPFHTMIVHYSNTPITVSSTYPVLIQPFTIWSGTTTNTVTVSSTGGGGSPTCTVAPVDNINLYLVTCQSLHFATAGSYTYTLTVRGSTGQTDTYTKSVTVTAAVSCGQFSLVPNSALGSLVNLYWFADPLVYAYGQTFSYQVNWGDGSSVQSVTAGGSTITSHNYGAPNSYTVTVSSLCENGMCSECAIPGFSQVVNVQEVSRPTATFGPFGDIYAGGCVAITATLTNYPTITSAVLTGDPVYGSITCGYSGSASLHTINCAVNCFNNPGTYDLVLQISDGVETSRLTTPLVVLSPSPAHVP